jgi:predicted O-methyltransferase YrrM
LARRHVGQPLVDPPVVDAAKASRTSCLNVMWVGSVVEVRVGDARETLDDTQLEAIDMVLLDGWNDLYLPVLERLEPRLAPGAVVIADDLSIAPGQIESYLGHERTPGNGWLSVDVPIDDGLEMSTWTGR